MKSSKGGPRRQKVEESCTEHLYDSLLKWYQGNSSFDFGEYNHLSKTQGSSIADIVQLEPFITSLMDVNPSLIFLYRNLKEVFHRLITKFPDLRKGVPLAKLGNQPGDLANSVTTLCTHVRRLKNKDFLEQSVRKCTAWQCKILVKLHEIMQTEDETPPLPYEDSKRPASGSVVAGSSLGKESAAEDGDESKGSEEELPKTQELLQLAIPASSEDDDESGSSDLLKEALQAKPVPPRKKSVREKLSTMRRPAAKTLNKISKSKATAAKAATAAMPTAANTKPSNYNFISETFGDCRVEFYSFKSYIRWKDPQTSKYKLIIQCEGHNHIEKMQKLVEESKKKGQSKEKLVCFRANL